MSRRIRVLRVQHSLVEPTNHALLDELQKFPDLEVRALCPAWGIESGNRREIQESAHEDITVARTLLTSHYATTFYVEKFGAMIRRFKPDIISVQEEPWSLAMAQAMALRRMSAPNAHLVFASAQNILKTYPFPFSVIERVAFRTAAGGFGCCEGVQDVVRAKGFAGPFEVAAMGLNPELFAYTKHGAVNAGGDFVMGYVGRLIEAKGVFTLLRALALVRGPVRLDMLGGGPAHDALLKEAAGLGGAGRVRILDPVPHAGVPRVMKEFDALVVPSETTPTWKEQFGRVIAEAFSMGLPVVGSDSGAVPEVIGDAGLVFPERNHKALAACLQSLIDNPELLRDLSAKGRARAMELFTWRKLAQQTRDLFLKIMGP